MDETLFYIVIFVIYVLFQVLGAKKKKKRPRPQVGQPLPGPTDRPEQPTAAQPTLEDALLEIRQALGMEPPPAPRPPVEEQPVRPAPRPLPPPRPKLHPVRTHGPELAETAPKKSWPSEFRAHPTHYADSDFEELATEGDRFGTPRKRKPQTLPSLKSLASPKRLVEPSKAPPSGVSGEKVVRQLNDPQAARNAFVLSEILGPPRAQKKHRGPF